MNTAIFLLKKNVKISFQIYGQYKRDLGSFAKFQAKKFKDQKDLGKTEIVKSKSRLGLYIILGIFYKIIN